MYVVSALGGPWYGHPMNDRDDLDALVRHLNADAPRAGPSDEQTAWLRSWLARVVAHSASDLLLVAGAPPSLRVESAVVPLMEAPLDGEEIAAAILPALPPHALQAYRDGGIADASYHARDLGRFRITLHRERGRAAPLFAGCRPLFHDWRHWACRHL